MNTWLPFTMVMDAISRELESESRGRDGTGGRGGGQHKGGEKTYREGRATLRSGFGTCFSCRTLHIPETGRAKKTKKTKKEAALLFSFGRYINAAHISPRPLSFPASRATNVSCSLVTAVADVAVPSIHAPIVSVSRYIWGDRRWHKRKKGHAW